MIRELEQIVLFDTGNLAVFVVLKSTWLTRTEFGGCKGMIIGVQTENLRGLIHKEIHAYLCYWLLSSPS